MLTAEQRELRNRVAVLATHRPDDDPDLAAARTALADATRRARARRAVVRGFAQLDHAERRELLAELAQLGQAQYPTTTAVNTDQS